MLLLSFSWIFIYTLWSLKSDGYYLAVTLSNVDRFQYILHWCTLYCILLSMCLPCTVLVGLMTTKLNTITTPAGNGNINRKYTHSPTEIHYKIFRFFAKLMDWYIHGYSIETRRILCGQTTEHHAFLRNIIVTPLGDRKIGKILRFLRFSHWLPRDSIKICKGFAYLLF